MDCSRFADQFGPPPQSPPIPIDWAVVESWLDLQVPADYKAIASAYGPLDIGEYIWLHVPCAQADRFDYGTWLRENHRWARISSRMVPPHEPPAFHPAADGLLAWGTTRRSDLLFWDTSASDNPDEWPVVIFHADAVHAGVNPWRGFGTSLLDTLTALVQTSLDLPGGGSLGPLPASARRTAFLSDAGAWAPPVPKPRLVPEQLQREALIAGSGLDTLRLLVPPPEAPCLGDGRWDDLFAELGTPLPTEYVALMDLYGAGIWSNWLRFATPLRSGATLAAYAQERLGWYRDLRDQFPEYHPLPIWPEPGGFLPFASSIDGDSLGWLTEGEPDRWPLIVEPRHHEQGPPLTGTLIDLLLSWLRGQPAAREFPHLDPLDDPLEFTDFQPWTDKAYW
ncbi:SMI1/KNR4 family protein [Micromonospora sp. MP36]|nr:SMI1/KNR4 family protein [Micromonospora sp. MP36]